MKIQKIVRFKASSLYVVTENFSSQAQEKRDHLSWNLREAGESQLSLTEG